jgi:excisionase family DNA binding protein
MNNQVKDDRIALMTPDEVAELLRVSKSTLYSWRQHSIGPVGLRIGKHLRYRWVDVEDYLNGLRSEAR